MHKHSLQGTKEVIISNSLVSEFQQCLRYPIWTVLNCIKSNSRLPGMHSSVGMQFNVIVKSCILGYITTIECFENHVFIRGVWISHNAWQSSQQKPYTTPQNHCTLVVISGFCKWNCNCKSSNFQL